MEKLRKKELIIILIMIALSLAMIPLVTQINKGDVVSVYVGGVLTESYSLEVDREIEIKTDGGINILTIKDGKAMVTHADCKDQICVHMAPISKKTPGIIVCLPHELVIELRE